jgi:hypothetical protein
MFSEQCLLDDPGLFPLLRRGVLVPVMRIGAQAAAGTLSRETF